MTKQPLAQPYEELIELVLDLVDRAFMHSDSQVVLDTRRRYMEKAVEGGWDLSDIFSELGRYNRIRSALMEKPSSKDLEPEHRQLFAAAGERRSQAMRWDNLFPDGETEIVLPLPAEAKSAEDRIVDYLERYNAASVGRFLEEQGRDEEALLSDPVWQRRAGNALSQKQVRRDPENASFLQMLNPRDGDLWKPGPRLGKFLLDRHEWELADIYEASRTFRQDAVAVEKPEQRPVSLINLAHRNPVSTDEFDPDCLRVVISRDPQKVGEMSTGQRWWSCMSTDHQNFSYVAKDIEAGTLVAYLVHRDDPQARWPFMRQLIKPFHNNEGETVLVPAHVYGDEHGGNSRSSDALQQAARGFVARQNEGKSGQFTMDHALYADEQAVDVSFAEPWNHSGLQASLRRYQTGAVTECRTELESNVWRSMTGRRGDHGEDPNVLASEYRMKLRHLYSATDCDAGLPRLFYRNVYETQIGTPPEPQAVRTAAAGSAELMGLHLGFEALMANDHGRWETIRKKLPEEHRIELAQAVGRTRIHKEDAAIDGPSAWAMELERIPDIEKRAELFFSIAQSHLPGKELSEAIAGIARNAVLLPDGDEKAKFLAIAVSLSSPGADQQRVFSDVLATTEAVSKDCAITTLERIARDKECRSVRGATTQALFRHIKQWHEAPPSYYDNLTGEKRDIILMGCQAVLADRQSPDMQERADFFLKVTKEILDPEERFLCYKRAVETVQNPKHNAPIYSAACRLLPQVVASSTELRIVLEFQDEALDENIGGPQLNMYFKIGKIILDSISKPGGSPHPGYAAHEFLSHISRFLDESDIVQDKRYAELMRRAVEIKDGSVELAAERPVSRMRGVAVSAAKAATSPDTITERETPHAGAMALSHRSSSRHASPS